MHARITCSAQLVHIEDLRSANGTYVNGRQISSSRLVSRDLIRVSDYAFEVHVPESNATELNGDGGEWDLSTHTVTPETVMAEAVEGDVDGTLHVSTSRVLGFFQQAGRILESAFELDDIVRGILDLVFRMIPAENGLVLLRDPDSAEMKVCAQRCLEGEGEGPLDDTRLSTTIFDHAVEQGKAVLTTDAQADDRFGAAQSVIDQDIRGAICVPLKGRTEILGAIYVDSRLASHRFSMSDLKLLTAVGAEMGVAVENARLCEANIRAERLAAVGQAIASLGHCIKNILNGMEGGSFILQKGVDSGKHSAIDQGWDILKRHSSRLKDLVLDMLAYARPREPIYAEIEGNAIPQEVVDLLREKAKASGVGLQFIPDQTLGLVLLDGKAIYRAVLNLISNAIEACPTSAGRVEVRTRRLPEHEQFQIMVQDNGCGISAEDLSKLGRVFFSTKGAQGTGLGLSVTYKVIAEHGGTVDVRSVPEEGTTFTVTLPVRRPASG
jgi:signal transduction histidine kinase